MLKSTTRLTPRRIVSSKSSLISSHTRFLSTAPPARKSRSWRSSAVRWGIAIGGVYWYNTSPLFAEEPVASIVKLDETIQHVQESNLPTVDAIVEEKRLRKLAAEREEELLKEAYLAARNAESPESREGTINAEELQEEAGQQAAFNPETGEINWDCPCLGGMAHGPCGEEFKAAFSCFVYSQEEPKGMECIDKFKGMQDCFRAHPEVYGAELEDDEEEIEEELRGRDEIKTRESEESKSADKNIPRAEKSAPSSTKSETVPEARTPPSPPPSPTLSSTPSPSVPAVESKPLESKTDIPTLSSEKQVKPLHGDGDSLIPKAAFDATDKN